MYKISGFSFLKLGIYGYIVVLLFNGIIKHYGLYWGMLESIRPFIPEFFVLLIFVGWGLTKKKVTKDDIIFVVWLIFVMLISIFNVPSAESVLSAIRDLVEPFVLLFLISTVIIEQSQKEEIHKRVENIFIIFIIVGFLYSMVQRINGSEWTSTYFAGHSVWGIDLVSGIRVTSGTFGFKVLGTTASAETFGFYNMLALIVVLFSTKIRKEIQIGLVATAFINMYCSGMKTAIIVSIIICYIFFMRKFGGAMNIFVKVGSVVLMIGLFYYMSFVLVDWEDSSFLQRMILWGTLTQSSYGINMLIPTNLFFFSAKAGNTGIISFWDNTYLYLMFSIGIVGLVLAIRLIYLKVKAVSKIGLGRLEITKAIFISFLISSVSTCVFLGRNYIAVAFIIIAYHYAGIRRNIG